ncbi:unnamed protein product, partial [Nesidiocoris tenuis]
MLDNTPAKPKFKPRGIPCVFVGYCDKSKAYRVWIPEEHRVKVNRDVKFLNENERALNKVEYSERCDSSSPILDNCQEFVLSEDRAQPDQESGRQESTIREEEGSPAPTAAQPAQPNQDNQDNDAILPRRSTRSTK